MLRPAAVLLAFLALAAPATAKVSPGAAAAALADDPVWVEPGASPALTVAERGRLRIEIVTEEIGRIKVAVVSAESVGAAGGIRRFAEETARRLDREGTLLVSAGGSFHVVYTFAQGRRIAPALQEIVDRHGEDGLFAVLDRAVSRIARIDPGGEAPRAPLDSGGGAPRIPDRGAPGADDAPGSFERVEDDVGDFLGVARGVVIAIGAAIVLAILVPVVLLLLRVRRGHRLAERREELAEADVRDRLVAVGDELRALDLDHSMPGADPEARAAYEAAVSHYDRAGTWLAAPEPDALLLARVNAELAQAEQKLATARERFAAGKASYTPGSTEGA